MRNKTSQKDFVYRYSLTIFAKPFSLSSHPWIRCIEVKSFLHTNHQSPWLFLQDKTLQTSAVTDTATADSQILFIYFSNHYSKLELSAIKAEHIPWSEEVILTQLSPESPTLSWNSRWAKLKSGWRGAPDTVAPWHRCSSAEVVLWEVKESEGMPDISAVPFASCLSETGSYPPRVPAPPSHVTSLP